MSNRSNKSRGEFTAYINVCTFIYGCTAIHNHLSLGFLFFAVIRWNTKNYYCAEITLN